MVAGVASGEKVVAATQSDTYKEIRSQESHLVAVEMEGFGFLSSAERNPVKAIVIRGISDLLDDKDPTGDQVWQPIASANASAFGFHLLDTLEIETA
jgi:nucleoside phosphorylase